MSLAEASIRRHLRVLPDIWGMGAVVIAAMVLAPLLAVLVIAVLGYNATGWAHLMATTLPRYFTNSMVMMLGVGVLAGAIGTATAWFVASRSFPGRGALQYLLLAPMAIPSYVAAYALVDMLEYAGPLQTALREVFGWSSARDYWFPEIRSRWAAILVMSLSLYPYIYLFARDAFEGQGMHTLDVSRALGCTPRQSYWRVSLPLARPAIVAGVAIVMMEVLNDFGTVEYFAVQTLTTGIFTQWLEASNPAGAAEIACLMLGLVLILALVERISRRRRRFHTLARSQRPVTRVEIKGIKRWIASAICAGPVLLGFVLPISVIASVSHLEDWQAAGLWRAARNTLLLGAVTALIAVSAALFLAEAVRHARWRGIARIMPLTTIGYAAPGAVLAVGVLIPLAFVDNWVADLVLAGTGVEIGLVLTGSAAALVFAYTVRFFAIAQGAVESGMAQVTPNMDMAARSLGTGRFGLMRRVHLPLLRGSILTAIVLIFVDTVKELPATLILRPFNFDTLATRVYNHASVEDLERAAPAALLVTVAGLLPVLLLSLRYRKRL